MLDSLAPVPRLQQVNDGEVVDHARFYGRLSAMGQRGGGKPEILTSTKEFYENVLGRGGTTYPDLEHGGTGLTRATRRF